MGKSKSNCFKDISLNTVLIAVGLILISLAAFFSINYRFLRSGSSTISVTGYATKDIVSDEGYIYYYFSADGDTRQKSLENAKVADRKIRERVSEYLEQEGYESFNYTVYSSTYDTTTNYVYTKEGRVTDQVEDYTSEGKFHIYSSDVYLIEALDEKTNDFIVDSVGLNSTSASYYYSQLDDLKIEMLEEAMSNARLRAETIGSGDSLNVKKVLSARQGVFQLNRKGDNSVSYGGNFNTSSIEKTLSITVNAEFSAR
jgi:hypothetical protein